MGPRYISFRLWHEMERRLGLMRRRYPTEASRHTFLSLDEWRATAPAFFFADRAQLRLPREPRPELAARVARIRAGEVRFFSADWKALGPDYDWLTNPDSGYRYAADVHWTKIPDYSREKGDIKYVWEKSRFTFLYDLIRYDYHFEDDQGEFVLSQLEDWLDKNRLNCGPNYRCSQEMSLRVLNWTFALYYYRYHPALTEARWQRVLNAIYDHLRHVRANIHFSRIAVRNNHAVTETLMLYLGGLLFPFLPGAAEWKARGRRWFEMEIRYQLYADGTFLQFSMNYHRVVVQLLSWALLLADRNGERWPEEVYRRAAASVDFLYHAQNPADGWLPNYGNNDGALFFPLTETHFRDFRPQLNALYGAVYGRQLYGDGPWREEVAWLTGGASGGWPTAALAREPLRAFPRGGYYLLRQAEKCCFIRCGQHKDRPYQADNLHLDLWYQGRNILRDAGTYKYNTDEATLRYFQGTGGHNTVQLGDYDQMLKGNRFMWFYWSQALDAQLTDAGDWQQFSGSARVYRHVAADIVHHRQVGQHKHRPLWEIKDRLSGSLPADTPLHQQWLVDPADLPRLHFAARDADGQPLQAQVDAVAYAEIYGQQAPALRVRFSTLTRGIHTEITIL